MFPLPGIRSNFGFVYRCFPLDLTDVKFHVFYAGCCIWSSDIVCLIRSGAWGGLWLSSSVSIARNLISLQLGFCTICPTSLCLCDFIEYLRTNSTSDTDHLVQTVKLALNFFSISTTSATTYFPMWRLCVWLLAVAADLWIFFTWMKKNKMVSLCTSNCLNEQFHNLNLEHKHVRHTAQWYCAVQGLATSTVKRAIVAHVPINHIKRAEYALLAHCATYFCAFLHTLIKYAKVLMDMMQRWKT